MSRDVAAAFVVMMCVAGSVLHASLERNPVRLPTAAASCRSCHSFEPRHEADALARSAPAGPDLSYAGTKYRVDWLTAWLAQPTRLRAGGYKPWTATVSSPDGDRIDSSRVAEHPRVPAAELTEVVAFLMSLRRETNPHPGVNVSGSANGELHFTKVLACGACHESQPGVGGVSGPEFYTAANRLNPEWLRAFIADARYWSSTVMPAGGLRAQQIDAIARYLLTPKPRDRAVGDLHGTGAAPAAATGRADALYRTYCSQCHGINGDGRGVNASRLFVTPRNHRSAEELGGLTDERLFAAIKFGGPAVGKASLMPAWSGTLSDADITLLVSHLRTLSGTGTGSGGE